MSAAAWIKPWIPPVARQILLRFRSGYSGLSGIHESWEAAKLRSSGYDQASILEKTISATEIAVRSKSQVYDRDSVIFRNPIVPFPLLAFLLLESSRRGGRLAVLDFGGSLGSTYRQCRPFLTHLSFLRWSIVEQPRVAKVGSERFTTNALRFYGSIEEAIVEDVPDVVIFSGVLQYLDEPYKILANAVAFKPSFIIIDRNPYSETNSDKVSLQIVSDAIFPARLPFRIFGDNSLENWLAPAYRKVAEFDGIDPDMIAGSLVVRFRGKAFERSLHEQQG
jgi:putative methyltransferase (TIGR04325 family)